MYVLSTLIVLSFSCCTLAGGADPDTVDAKYCSIHESCGNCIAAGCSWCKQENYTLKRCNLTFDGCSEFLNSTYQIINFNESGSVQLYPQNITIRVRPNSKVSFPIRFQQAKDYPFDLYFLIDVSNSMKALMVQLVTLSDTLAKTLHNLTKDYYIGLGTFMDKTTMPYVNVENIASWCPTCAEPYSFQNNLNLTNNISHFQTAMNSTKTSGNLDMPEGVFDALMQAAVCKKNIGWRDQSRKLVVVSTDAEFHVGGDGMLGGLAELNDGECHLNSNGLLVNNTYQDYPSISLLARKVTEKKINVIFAVKADKVQAYEGLSSHIEGSHASVLSGNFSNVVDLIKDNYNKISSTVILKAEKSDDVIVSFQSSCLGTVMSSTSVCHGLHIGQNVTFETTIEVKLASCPMNESEWFKTVHIYPVGLTEQLTVNIELDCKCSCQKLENKEQNSAACNGHGTQECGLCVCDKGFYGESCECSFINDNQMCWRNGQVCDGLGQCKCGKCECDGIQSMPGKNYSGKYCECNDYTCDYYNGELCGGDSRGKCVCGKCSCIKGWQGDRCDCSTDNSQCIGKNKNKTCNDKGNCKCGKCLCESTLFSGSHCEECPTCTGECEQYNDCIKCHFLLDKQDCSKSCSTTVVELVDILTDNGIMCSVQLENMCSTNFVYNDKLNILQARKAKTCDNENSENSTMILIGVVAGILTVGISLLCTWKVFVTLHDRREYARFEEEKKNAVFGATENPLYKKATATYKNPTFASGS